MVVCKKMIEQEKWLPIEGFSLYEVSNRGRIRNKNTNRILNGTKGPGGYRIHRLYFEGKQGFKNLLTHRLVAKAFVPNKDPERCVLVNHIDEDKMNPDASNLEWVTSKENANHGNRNKLISKGGRPVCEYTIDGEYIRTWQSAVAVSKVYSVGARSIHDPCRNKKGVVYGRQWRYWDDTKGKPIKKASLRSRLKPFVYPETIPEDYLFKSTEPLEALKQIVSSYDIEPSVLVFIRKAMDLMEKDVSF